MSARPSAVLAALVMLAVYPACATTQQTAAPPAEDGGRSLLSVERIAALPPADRAAWTRYVDASHRLHASDTTAMSAELRNAGLAHMSKAPYAAPDFNLAERKDDWIRSDSARLIADAVLTFQTPSGGWSKRTDMRRPRLPGMSYYSETEEWHYIPTLDNGATTGQLRFLARVVAVYPDSRYTTALRRGLDYVIAAQQPNGCWPQSFPLEGSYHDAITFNDDATVLVLRLLDEVASGKVRVATTEERTNAEQAARRGVGCLVATQVVVNGERTVWGQQHDPVTLEVVPARRYELAGLAGRESAAIAIYLMSLPTPDPKVVTAVHAAAEWFRKHAITGYAYDYTNGLHAAPNGGPIWARLSEIGTNRPIFSNRDAIKLYDSNLLTDRRTGYAWFGSEPAAALKAYEAWARAHPRTVNDE